MDAVEFAVLKGKWDALCKKLGNDFGEEPDLQSILFLIGVQELGQGRKVFEKEDWYVLDATTGNLKQTISPNNGSHNTIYGPNGKENDGRSSPNALGTS